MFDKTLWVNFNVESSQRKASPSSSKVILLVCLCPVWGFEGAAQVPPIVIGKSTIPSHIPSKCRRFLPMQMFACQAPIHRILPGGLRLRSWAAYAALLRMPRSCHGKAAGPKRLSSPRFTIRLDAKQRIRQGAESV